MFKASMIVVINATLRTFSNFYEMEHMDRHEKPIDGMIFIFCHWKQMYCFTEISTFALLTRHHFVSHCVVTVEPHQHVDIAGNIVGSAALKLDPGPFSSVKIDDDDDGSGNVENCEDNASSNGDDCSGGKPFPFDHLLIFTMSSAHPFEHRLKQFHVASSKEKGKACSFCPYTKWTLTKRI